MPFTVLSEDRADCVKVSVPSVGVPFVFGQMPIIVGVDDGIFAPGQRYAAEGAAVADVAIGKYGPRSKLFQPNRNFNNDFDCPLPRELQKY